MKIARLWIASTISFSLATCLRTSYSSLHMLITRWHISKKIIVLHLPAVVGNKYGYESHFITPDLLLAPLVLVHAATIDFAQNSAGQNKAGIASGLWVPGPSICKLRSTCLTWWHDAGHAFKFFILLLHKNVFNSLIEIDCITPQWE